MNRKNINYVIVMSPRMGEKAICRMVTQFEKIPAGVYLEYGRKAGMTSHIMSL